MWIKSTSEKPISARVRLPIAVGLLALLAWSGLLTRIEIGLIHAYRSMSHTVMPLGHCRYRPSCSAHGLESLADHGLIGGNLRIARRSLLCSPIGAVLDHYGFDTGSIRFRPQEHLHRFAADEAGPH